MQGLVGRNIEIALLGIILLGFMASLAHWASRSSESNKRMESYMSQASDFIEIDQNHRAWQSPEIGN